MRPALKAAKDLYLSLLDQITEAKRSGDAPKAERLLLEAVASTEASVSSQCGVNSWYYEQLAILYRKQKRLADEAAILERYAQQPSPGPKSKGLLARLEKTRGMLRK
jgi:hypothetical protein